MHGSLSIQTVLEFVHKGSVVNVLCSYMCVYFRHNTVIFFYFLALELEIYISDSKAKKGLKHLKEKITKKPSR